MLVVGNWATRALVRGTIRSENRFCAKVPVPRGIRACYTAGPPVLLSAVLPIIPYYPFSVSEDGVL